MQIQSSCVTFLGNFTAKNKEIQYDVFLIKPEHIFFQLEFPHLFFFFKYSWNFHALYIYIYIYIYNTYNIYISPSIFFYLSIYLSLYILYTIYIYIYIHIYTYIFAFNAFNCFLFFLIGKRWLLKPFPSWTYCGLYASK